MSMRQFKISNTITSRESVSLNKYMLEIGKVKILSPEEEAALCREIKKGNSKALDQLIKANLRFVVSVAKHYQGQGLLLCDLVNEGNIGLIQAAKKFDETRGFRFISFAVWCIRQQIMVAIADQAQLVRVPLNKTVLMKRVKKTSALMEQQLGRAPSAEELAEEMNMSAQEIDDIQGIHQPAVSFDSPVGEEEDGSSLLDTFINPGAEQADREYHHSDSLKTEISRQLGVLTDRQKETICYYFGLGRDQPMSLDIIADKFDLTTERVRQIRDKAIEKLRSSCQFQVLRTYL